MSLLSGRKILIPALSIFSLFISCDNHDADTDYAVWNIVGGNSTGNKYSSLTQIDTSNVHQLKVAWTYHTGDADTAAHSQIQCNPIVVNGILYCTSPALKLIALDAATGKEIWKFSPFANDSIHYNLNNNRGVAYWTDHKDDERLFYAAGPFMYAVDAKTGKAKQDFGNNGRIKLIDGLGEEFKDLYIGHSSAPSVYKDLLITGTRVSEAMDAAPGHIRAYDVRTGQQRWIFHTIPQPGEPGHETWEDPNAWKFSGGANNWMGMTIDHERGVAFIPTGSASMDFWGGKRKGANLYANCLLALDANTGKRIWHFQYIHHDTWDWDPSSYPVLLTVNHNGKKIDAVAQTSKTGFVYLFNRENGEPLFPIVETPVDTTTRLKGEKLWPTQPIPQKPAPFVRQTFTEKDINPHLSPESYEEVKKRLAGSRHGKMFTPQSTEGTIIFPGFDGGAEWGGPAVDPSTNMLFVNANEMAWIMEMKPADETGATKENFGQAGERLYKQHCMACHGVERKGSGNYPSLLDVGKKYNPQTLVEFVNAGRRMMPAFQHLKTQEKEAIADFLLEVKKNRARAFSTKLTAAEEFRKVPYNISGYNKFLSKEGRPAIGPPWGTLTAIDMNSGEHVWKVVLGEDSLLSAKGVKETGTENYGGPVVTRGGVIFIAASRDGKFRAYNKFTGKLLWETALPAPGFATPATYSLNGKQYIAIACGGGKLGTPSADAYVAYALP